MQKNNSLYEVRDMSKKLIGTYTKDEVLEIVPCSWSPILESIRKKRPVSGRFYVTPISEKLEISPQT